MSVKFSAKPFVIMAILTLGIASVNAQNTAPAAGHEHGHTGGTLTLDHGAKWAIDAPLSKAMNSIRDAVAASLGQIHANTLAANGYTALAGKIRSEVAYMVSNCKLEPAADEQLHLIIADLLGAADQMEAGADSGSSRDGAIQVVGALENYATFFNDAGWVPLQH